MYWNARKPGASGASEELAEQFAKVKNEHAVLSAKKDELVTRQENIRKQRWADAEREGKIVFLRFGQPPKSGKSHNYRDEEDESGVSAYEAIDLGNGLYEFQPNMAFLMSGPSFMDRKVYRLTGEQVGRGSDGEPVVKVSRADELSKVEIYHPVTGWKKYPFKKK
jgi:hypothetical protein